MGEIDEKLRALKYHAPWLHKRPPTHMHNKSIWDSYSTPLCGATEEPIYLSDNKPLCPNGRVTCFACLSLIYKVD